MSPPAGAAPSATTMIVKWRPLASRARTAAATRRRSNGISGMRMTSAPPAMPPKSAIQPAWRPITSTTITRRWLYAVGCRRSTRLGHHRDRGVEPEGELGGGQVVVDRLRHADHGEAGFGELERDAERAVAADADERVDPERDERRARPLDDRGVEHAPIAERDLHREAAAVRGSENRAAAADDARGVLPVEDLRRLRVQQALEAVGEADDRQVAARRGTVNGADDGVQTGRVAAAGDDPERPHRPRRRRIAVPRRRPPAVRHVRIRRRGRCARRTP